MRVPKSELNQCIAHLKGATANRVTAAAYDFGTFAVKVVEEEAQQTTTIDRPHMAQLANDFPEDLLRKADSLKKAIEGLRRVANVQTSAR